MNKYILLNIYFSNIWKMSREFITLLLEGGGRDMTKTQKILPELLG